MRRKRPFIERLFDVSAWRRSPWLWRGLGAAAVALYLLLMGELLAASRRDTGPRPSPFARADDALSVPLRDDDRPDPASVSSLDMAPKLPPPAAKPPPPPDPAPPEAPPADDSGDDRPDWAKPAAAPVATDGAPPAAPARRLLVPRDMPALKTSTFKTSAFLPNAKPESDGSGDAAAASKPAPAAKKKRESREYRDIRGSVEYH